LNLYLWLGTGVPFTWYVTLGTLTTALAGYAASRFLPERRRIVTEEQICNAKI
jgi:hypothetical protein